MKITPIPYRLRFKYPFQLAAGARSHTDTVILKLDWEGVVGYGEASLPPYLGENIASVLHFLEKIESNQLNPFEDLEAQLAYVDGIDLGNNAAKAAVDIALHDLRGKLLGCSISQMVGLPEGALVPSTYTIGITASEDFAARLQEAANFDLVKLKLGSKNDRQIVKQYLSLSGKPFCVDVNQGWTDKVYASEMADFLHDSGALFIEQPMPKSREADTAWLSAHSKLPIIADEAVQRLADLERVAEHYDGINVKLMKSTGISEAHRMITEARRLGLKIVVGCMAESSCAVTAAAHLAPLADWADLDGPMLITNDPFEGFVFQDGRAVVPHGAGLGVGLINGLELRL